MFTIDHLDNRRLVVRSSPGEVVKPGDFKKIRDEGMPMAKNSYVKGHMYVEFDVIFPPSGSITAKQKAELKAILPNPSPAAVAAEDEKSRFGGPTGAAAASTGPSAVDEEEDEEGTPSKPLSRTIEEVQLHECDINMERRNAQQQARGHRGDATNAGHDDDDDDDDPRRGGQAGCQTQ
jgi:DnaJ-class molecular chaperone